MSKIRIGIDIGANGAYAIFIDNELKQYGKIPGKDELDMKALINILTDFNDATSYHAAFEDLHSIFGSSAKSNFQFGVNNGLVIGMLQTASMPYTKIQAKKWQKEMWEGIRPVEILVKGKTNKDGSPKYKIDTKATSLLAAKRLFPKESFLATERSKVSHDGIVDAVLIGSYCNRHF